MESESEGVGKQGFGELIDAFGKAWEAGDGEAVTALFLETAIFQPDPFEKGLKGHPAIKSYWVDLPKEQAEVRFRRGEIFSVGPWFSTEFRCTFRRRRTGEWVDIRGSLFCETEEGKFSEMRMYWHRAVGGRDG
ncbi:MAG: nuclear transport factor 2 family protein [Gemmatimonadota bacterium]|nr:nuclear transport factor 2 family protein [Gemmatimonadota bacterium]MDH5803873.1 nuclear transport factor 2 family protein [Gemmatimonadota bacterium]